MLSHDVYRIQHRTVRRGNEECVSLDTQDFADQHFGSSRDFPLQVTPARWPRATGKRPSAARRSTRQDAPLAQRLRQRAAVDVFELPADRYAAREPCNLELARAEQLGDVMRGRLALVGEDGRQHDLADRSIERSLEPPVQANLLGTDAVKRRQAAHENEI